MEENKTRYFKAETADGNLIAFDPIVNPWMNSEIEEEFTVYPVDSKTLVVDESKPYKLKRGFISRAIRERLDYPQDQNQIRSL